jgi:hypothetical protein
MMKYELYSKVALLKNIPEESLQVGDIATIVDFHPGNGERQDAYSLEVFNAIGETIAVVGVAESEIAALNSKEILHIRELVSA